MVTTKSKSDKLARVQSLVLTRVIDASPAVVFDAWTQPEKVMKWFSPRDFTTPFCTIDLRVGGICRLCMRSSQGQVFWPQSVFREIIRPKRIVRTVLTMRISKQRDMCEQGWSECLDKLTEYLRKG